MIPTMPALSGSLPYLQIALSVVLVASVLLQQSGAGLGGAFGDNWSSSFSTRRGAEKIFFILTIIVGILFFFSAFLALIF